MDKENRIWKLNGMKIIMDVQGLPEKLAMEMKRVCDSPWLTMKQKVHCIDNAHKKYLTDLAEKNKSKHSCS